LMGDAIAWDTARIAKTAPRTTPRISIFLNMGDTSGKRFSKARLTGSGHSLTTKVLYIQKSTPIAFLEPQMDLICEKSI
jgi:hypothetical protein